jgi:hypothetical protein
MQTIIVIDNMVLKDGTLYAVGREEEETKVFLKQGIIEGRCGGKCGGKCAVYSLMMMLIFHKRINREDLLDKYNLGTPPYIKELKKQLLLRTKRGFSMRSLRDKLLLSFNNHIPVDVFSIRNFTEDDLRKLHFMIKEQLDAGWPVQIGFSFPEGKVGHSVVAVGYTICEKILRLFCLDYAFDLEFDSMWNNIIDINIDYDNLFKLDFNHNVNVEVYVDSILLIKDKLDKPDKLDLPFEPEEKNSILPF